MKDSIMQSETSDDSTAAWSHLGPNDNKTDLKFWHQAKSPDLIERKGRSFVVVRKGESSAEEVCIFQY